MADLTDEQLRNIQGLGLAGFRKDIQDLIGVRFRSADAGRRLLKVATPLTANAWEVRAFNALFSEIRRRTGGMERIVEATWHGLLISAKGYSVLGVNTNELPAGEGSAAFASGMLGRAAQIGDTRPTDSPDQWLDAFRDGGLHALIVLASDSRDDLDEALDALHKQIEATGCEQVWYERGETLPDALRGHEHFGFKDGVSQPSIAGFEPPPEADEPTAVALGEFVLGYPDETGNAGAGPVGDLWSDGSFVVFRRLCQDVAAFRAQVAAQVPDADPQLTPEQLAAKLVGRWPSGTPTAVSPDADPGESGVTNAFAFADDGDGVKTPRFSHIRKANPRDEDRPDAAGDPTQRHRMIRRGAPFGQPLPAGAAQDDGAERGLHFICVVADLARQFEFVQRNWLNEPNFPNGGAPGTPGGPYTQPAPGIPADGPDPIVGEHEGGAQVTLRQANDGVHPFALQAQFVRMTGGEYFFLPSIGALARLADGATASTAQAPAAPAAQAAAP